MRSCAFTAGSAALLYMNMAFTPSLTSPTHEAWLTEIKAWRVEHAADLQKPDGWLSLAGLEWLEPGDNSFGGASDNKIHLAGLQTAHLGVLRLEGATVHLAPPSENFPAGFLVASSPPKPQLLPTDADSDNNAPHMTIGTLNMYVIRRGDRFALRVKDSKSQPLQSFHGENWYEPDEHFRVIAKWIPYNPPRTVSLLTLAGTSYTQPVPGAAEFQISGATFQLEPVVEDSEPNKLFFVLRDTTSTKTTYGACRFLYTGLPDHGLTQPGELVMDFNRLENPPCAYTPFATCPLPPKGNRLPIALPVGERRYHN